MRSAGAGRAAREWLVNFAAGGALVAMALYAARLSSPVIGGIIAAMPVKYAATWLIGGLRNGTGFAEKLAEGSLVGMAGNLVFSLTLFLSLRTLGLVAGFSAAVAACLLSVAALRLIFRGRSTWDAPSS